MTIKMDASGMMAAVVTTVIFGGITFLCYKAAKSEEETRKKNKEYKDTRASSINFTEEINRASFKNENFDPTERANAYSVLMKYKNKFDKAYKMEDIDESFSKFLNLINGFTGDDPVPAKAMLMWETNLIKHDNANAQKREEREAESNNYKIIADAIKTISKDVLRSQAINNNSLTEYTLRKILNGDT